MQFLFSWVDTLASATTLLLQFNVIFVCQKKSWNHSKSVSSERIRKRKQTVTNWQDKNDDAVFVSIMWKRKEIFLIFFSVKSGQKKIVKMTQCPVAYWSTPLTPEDRLRQLPNGKKIFKSFKPFKIWKNWNCRWLKIQIRILESAQSFFCNRCQDIKNPEERQLVVLIAETMVRKLKRETFLSLAKAGLFCANN